MNINLIQVGRKREKQTSKHQLNSKNQHDRMVCYVNKHPVGMAPI